MALAVVQNCQTCWQGRAFWWHQKTNIQIRRSEPVLHGTCGNQPFQQCRSGIHRGAHRCAVLLYSTSTGPV